MRVRGYQSSLSLAVAANISEVDCAIAGLLMEITASGNRWSSTKQPIASQRLATGCSRCLDRPRVWFDLELQADSPFTKLPSQRAAGHKPAARGISRNSTELSVPIVWVLQNDEFQLSRIQKRMKGTINHHSLCPPALCVSKSLQCLQY